MPTPDQTRIMADRAAPRPMQLWWAMAPLRSTVRFMMSGAHPDDEISDLLAALAFRDGVNLSYACSTRGEGGQNDKKGPVLNRQANIFVLLSAPDRGGRDFLGWL